MTSMNSVLKIDEVNGSWNLPGVVRHCDRSWKNTNQNVVVLGPAAKHLYTTGKAL